MGAPTGSAEVKILTLALDAAVLRSSVNPVMEIVAGALTECCLISVQVCSSGFHVRIAACSDVNSESSPFATTVGSSSPRCRCSPATGIRIALVLSANDTSTTQRFASLASRQRNVGGVISGGKIEPSSG